MTINITIATTTALADWMKLSNLPRLPQSLGRQLGIEPLLTDSENISWQCHLSKVHIHSHYVIIIAMEAYSRFILLIPLSHVPTQSEFERLLARHWMHNLSYWMEETQALSEEAIPAFLQQFATTPRHFHWVKNNDLSINSHIADANQCVRQSFRDFGTPSLSETQAFSLGSYINKIPKQTKQRDNKYEQFSPIKRIVNDGLYRFCHGITPDMENPYAHMAEFPSLSYPNNVISLTEYARKKIIRSS